MMIPPMVPDPKRANLQFALETQSAFEFLETEFGFRRVSADITFVRYEFDRMFVNVYHGRSSFELGVEVGRSDEATPSAEPGFRLEELLELLGLDHRFRYQAATAREVVRLELMERATSLRLHGKPLLEGDPGTLTKLKQERQQGRAEYAKGLYLRQVRRKVELAWKNKDYPAVVSLYESIRDDLTEVEAKKLAHARKRV